MTALSSHQPIVCIDMKKSRIRIHRQTLHLLGDPDYIQLLVNPSEQVIAIRKSFAGDHLAHRVYPELISDSQCYELYSKDLIRTLKTLCDHWEENSSFRIYGVFNQKHLTALFPMKEINAIKEKPVNEQ